MSGTINTMVGALRGFSSHPHILNYNILNAQCHISRVNTPTATGTVMFGLILDFTGCLSSVHPIKISTMFGKHGISTFQNLHSRDFRQQASATKRVVMCKLYHILYVSIIRVCVGTLSPRQPSVPASTTVLFVTRFNETQLAGNLQFV